MKRVLIALAGLLVATAASAAPPGGTKIAAPWASGMDFYERAALDCSQGDRISCRQAKELAQDLAGAGWCANGLRIETCPGYTVVSASQWKQHLAERARAEQAQARRPDPNNPYMRAVQNHYNRFGQWAEVKAYYDR